MNILQDVKTDKGNHSMNDNYYDQLSTDELRDLLIEMIMELTTEERNQLWEMLKVKGLI